MRLRNQSSAASLALSAAFSASAIGSASAMAATPQTATQSVSYLGHQFTVPASWPVIDLGRAPSTCVRLWLATGNGASITSKDNPFLLGVA